MKPITESHIEQSAIKTLQAQGWAYVNGKDGHYRNGIFIIFANYRIGNQDRKAQRPKPCNCWLKLRRVK